MDVTVDEAGDHPSPAELDVLGYELARQTRERVADRDDLSGGDHDGLAAHRRWSVELDVPENGQQAPNLSHWSGSRRADSIASGERILALWCGWKWSMGRSCVKASESCSCRRWSSYC